MSKFFYSAEKIKARKILFKYDRAARGRASAALARYAEFFFKIGVNIRYGFDCFFVHNAILAQNAHKFN